MSSNDLRECDRQCIEDTRTHRQDPPFFIDKVPNNFRHIGLIHLILPNAKIIDARRDPMDCCFSCFKKLFAEGPACVEFHRAERVVRTGHSRRTGRVEAI